ncbi:MAG: hypothetical protein M9935_11640, partial [Kiritimatiellae bacterium]|nr:hypothetical protein [Kiritimatiellia bacterium]
LQWRRSAVINQMLLNVAMHVANTGEMQFETESLSVVVSNGTESIQEDMRHGLASVTMAESYFGTYYYMIATSNKQAYIFILNKKTEGPSRLVIERGEGRAGSTPKIKNCETR